MFQKIIAFIMSIITFIMQLFGISSSKFIEMKNVSYGSDAAQMLDVCFPKNTPEVSLIVFIHGGAWVEGDKSEYIYSCEYAAEYNSGIAAATINYRMLDQGYNCDDILEDVGLAIEKIKSCAADNGITIKSAALGGGSAGGHISMLYSYKCADESPLPLSFVFSLSGPTDLTDPSFFIGNSIGDERILDIAGKLAGVTVTAENFNDADIQAALKAVSPVTYVTSSSVPTLMAHGMKDITVPFSNAETLDAALTSAGVKHDFFVYPNSDHSLSSDSDVAAQFDEKLQEYTIEYFQ